MYSDIKNNSLTPDKAKHFGIFLIAFLHYCVQEL